MGQKAEKRIKMILKDGTLSGYVFADDGKQNFATVPDCMQQKKNSLIR